MTSRALARQPDPGAQQEHVQEIDPIALQIQWSRLVSIMEEVDIALVRTSFSTIVGESRDFAVILLDAQARSIAQSEMSSPAFTCSLPGMTRTLLKEFPPETLAPGDVLITNDPWLCHGHLPDICLVVPIFGRSGPVAYIAMAAHVSDIGGRMDEFDSRDLYEEGLQIPPAKLYEGGKRNALLYRIIETNIRFSTEVIGDIEAMVGAARIGSARYADLIADYGEPALALLASTILTRSEEAMRRAIGRIPAGRYGCDITVDGYNSPNRIVTGIEARGDSLHVDFSGTDPQRTDGAVNCVMNVTHAEVLLALKSSLTTEIPNNEGLFAPITSFAPEGCILNATRPAPVKSRTMTSIGITQTIFGALAQVLPESVQAGSASFFSVKCRGSYADGERFGVYMLPAGGRGASLGTDGAAATPFPSNGMITPVEIFENRSPVLFLERSMKTDSGGAGEFRGGLAQTIRLTVLGDETALVTLRPDKVKYPAKGLLGGADGAPGRVTLDGQPVPIKPLVLARGQELRLDLPGGAGFGDPRKRDRSLVKQDLDLGLISPEVARNDYGYEE
ncbi:MAG: hydantoinase B/oxoprolinase family protein [Rhizobiaceae bacterium]